MIRSPAMLGALVLAATSSLVLAQQGGQQPPARGPEMALALEAAQAAMAACAANGIKAAVQAATAACPASSASAISGPLAGGCCPPC